MTDFRQLFNDRFERNVLHGGDAFFKVFYDTLLARSDAIRQMFERTDFLRQRTMLKESLAFVVAFSGSRVSSEYLEDLSLRHQSLGVKDEHYDLWLEALLETLRTVDSEHTEMDSLAWRIFLLPGMEFMRRFRAVDGAATR